MGVLSAGGRRGEPQSLHPPEAQLPSVPHVIAVCSEVEVRSTAKTTVQETEWRSLGSPEPCTPCYTLLLSAVCSLEQVAQAARASGNGNYKVTRLKDVYSKKPLMSVVNVITIPKLLNWSCLKHCC